MAKPRFSRRSMLVLNDDPNKVIRYDYFLLRASLFHEKLRSRELAKGLEEKTWIDPISLYATAIDAWMIANPDCAKLFYDADVILGDRVTSSPERYIPPCISAFLSAVYEEINVMMDNIVRSYGKEREP